MAFIECCIGVAGRAGEGEEILQANGGGGDVGGFEDAPASWRSVVGNQQV